jgi:hypothetical protein
VAIFVEYKLFPCSFLLFERLLSDIGQIVYSDAKRWQNRPHEHTAPTDVLHGVDVTVCNYVKACEGNAVYIRTSYLKRRDTFVGRGVKIILDED